MALSNFCSEYPAVQHKNAIAYQVAYKAAVAELRRFEEKINESARALRHLEKQAQEKRNEFEARKAEFAIFLKFAKKAFPELTESCCQPKERIKWSDEDCAKAC